MLQPMAISSSQQGLDSQRASDHASFLQAASDLRLNRSLLARDLLAQANNPASMMTPFNRDFFAGSLSGLQSQGAHQDVSSFLSGLNSRPQNLSDSLYLQQALGGNSCSSALLSNLNAGPAPSNSLTLPSSTLASLSSRIPALLNANHRSNKELQEALATLKSVSAPLSGPHSPAIEHDVAVSPGAHNPVVVYMECDEESLSDYQCLLRKQIELFEA